MRDIVYLQNRLIQNSVLNGLTVAILLMIPMALAVSASSPKDFLPMMMMAIVLGPITGISLNKFVR